MQKKIVFVLDASHIFNLENSTFRKLRSFGVSDGSVYRICDSSTSDNNQQSVLDMFGNMCGHRDHWRVSVSFMFFMSYRALTRRGGFSATG